ncbi:MAG: ATP synthase subunit I [Deltaproteobacteria bacterium]|nr:ATP synthase subunit I [Deltaproteobacteria bacterium]
MSSSPVVVKAALANLAAFAAGLALTFYIGASISIAAGFTVGYALGVFNIYWLLRIARRGPRLKPEKVGRYVVASYYARFLLTAFIFVLLIVWNILAPPWPPVVGLSAAIFTNVVIMIISLMREEAI